MDNEQNTNEVDPTDTVRVDAPVRHIKPSGWNGKKTDEWWTKNSVYGVRYKCPWCLKETLGIVWGEAQKTMHRKNCPRVA